MNQSTALEVQHPQQSPHVSWSVLLSGIILGLLAAYLFLTFAYTKEQPLSTINTTNLTRPSDTPKPPPMVSKLGPLNHTFTFQDVFNELRDIDKVHKTDFRKESLRKQMLPLARIPPALNMLEQLREDLNRSVIGNETVYWIHLVNGRIEQLESERYLQLALALGRRGLFSKNVSESCQRRQDILDASSLYNQSARHGGLAMYHFDEALTQEQTWPVLGINENRMAFYGGDTRDVGALATSQLEKVRTKCLGLPDIDDSPGMMEVFSRDEVNESKAS